LTIPTDTSRYLVHSCLEGPEGGVYYRGEGAIVEGIDTTVVHLPDYISFAYDFTINITPIGNPRALGVSRVKNGRFCVYGPPGEFFWTVYGKRINIDPEPLKHLVEVKGQGPYRWI
jgi:hypothetical protein